MKALIAVQNLFSSVGGGQTFLRNVICQHPEIDFYYFGTDSETAPSNAHAIPISDHHRSRPGGLYLHEISLPRPELRLDSKDGDVALLLDMAVAAAATGHYFDSIEIPDFTPFGALLPEFLRVFGVRCDRVLLSLHGALSLSIRQLWQGPNPNDLTTLETYERMLYRVADVRYGISARYLDELAAREGLQGLTVDPFLAVNVHDLSWGSDYQPQPEATVRAGRWAAGSKRPDLNFVGRQDQIKGPDLFLYLAANLPPKGIGSINLFGSSVNIDGVNSTSILSRIAERRGLKIEQDRLLPYHELIDLYALGRGITFTTSRVDTFNLVAFESLMNGCPTVISTACGICNYLDEAWPGLPYVKFDPDDIWAALPNVMDILDNYDEHRAQLNVRLTAHPRPSYGVSMDAVFDAQAQFDPVARRELSAVADEIGRHIDRRLRPAYLHEKLGESITTARSHAHGHSTTDNSANIPNLLYGADALDALIREDGRAFSHIAEVENTIQRLKDIAEHRRAERIGVFDLLAKAEQLRGNDLLYAVYQMRRFRLGRRVEGAVFTRVRDILNSGGFPAEAKALELLYRGTSDEVYEHLHAQRALCWAPNDQGIEFVEHFNRRENPRVAVLVSVYNAESKIAQFVQGMRSFVPETLRGLEVIFVDSGSPDASSAALRRELSKPTSADRALDATIMRTTNRETIQAAWNRALTVVRAPYITFLGADEMMRPDSLEILGGILDRQPDVDWVQGNAVVCEVNIHGTPVRDVMVYNRMLDRRFMHYLDCCYMGWVGGLYRRRVHDTVGYYNPTFRAAGDNEFKNRALPAMTVKTIPDVLGTFRNFPEERTTESPIAEIEDLRAWYLPRSVGGMRYAFEGSDPAEAVQLFFRCLAYRKTYMDITCTDIDLAMSVATYIEQYHPDRFCEIQQYVPAVLKAANAYRQLDNLITFPISSPLITLAKVSAYVKDMALQVAKAEEELKHWLPGVTLGLTNDSRYHQHQNVWKSTPKRYQIGPMLNFGDLAGPQDLAEMLSSCRSDDPMVDFETAWTSDQFSEARRLFDETALCLALAVPDGDIGEETAVAVTDALAEPLSRRDGVSLVIAGAVARRPAWTQRRVYVLGRTRTLRPVLAACRLAILPYWSPAGVSLMLPVAVKLLCSGKPVLVSRPLADRLSATLGDLSDAQRNGCLIVCETIESLAEKALGFALAPDEDRAAASRNARALASRLRADPDNRNLVDAAPGEMALPADADWLLEWDGEFDAINRAFHSFIERDGELLDRLIRIEKGLGSATMGAKLEACADRLLARKDAHALFTRQSFFQTLRRRPAAPSGKAGLASLYLETLAAASTAGGASSPDVQVPAFDLVIPAAPTDWFLSAFEWFMTEVYGPHLAKHGFTVGVTGIEPPEGYASKTVALLPLGQDEGALVRNARLVVCLGSEQAALRPSTLERVWPALRHGKPVTGMRDALWFFDGVSQETVTWTGAEELAGDIVNLLSNPSAAESRGRLIESVCAHLEGRLTVNRVSSVNRGEVRALTPA